MKWLAAAALFLLLAWQFHLGLLVVAAYAMGGLLFFSRLSSHAWARRLSATRVCKVDSGEIGTEFDVAVHITNEGGLNIPWLLLEDGVPLTALSQRPAALRIIGKWAEVERLGAHETVTFNYRVECLRRGYYQFGPLLAETGDLFGLHRNFRLLTEPHFVLIRPKTLPMDGYDIASPRPVGEIRLVHRLFEDTSRINGVREYQRGDPLNRIHWHATARTGILQSKTFESTSVAGATLLLDFHRASYPPPGDYYASELAITLAATLARALSEIGQQCGLVTNGRDAADRMKFQGWNLEFKTRDFARRGQHLARDNRCLTPSVVETRRDADQFERILDTLARLEMTEEYLFSTLAHSAAAQLPRSATVAAIISHATPETASALGGLRRRGYSVLALVITIDERAEREWATPPEWAAILLQEGISFRAVPDESAVTRLCAEFAATR